MPRETQMEMQIQKQPGNGNVFLPYCEKGVMGTKLEKRAGYGGGGCRG